MFRMTTTTTRDKNLQANHKSNNDNMQENWMYTWSTRAVSVDHIFKLRWIRSTVSIHKVYKTSRNNKSADLKSGDIRSDGDYTVALQFPQAPWQVLWGLSLEKTFYQTLFSTLIPCSLKTQTPTKPPPSHCSKTQWY